MMRSKQKLEPTTQNALANSLQAVLKQQDFFTSSTVHSQETTKLETLGQTHTNKNCVFEDGHWWYVGASDGSRRKMAKFQERNNARMWVNGKYIPLTHPLHKAGRYKGFEEAAFSSLENFKDSAQGQVYIITNPAWEGWVKVGMAVDAEDRAGNYQTSSPFRDYELGYVVDTLDRRATEAETHARLGDLFEQRNEWFKCSVEMAQRIIDGVVGEENE